MSRVCVFGDSIVWGAWDTRGGWVGRLYSSAIERAGNDTTGDYLAVYNCGISGDKLSDVINRFDVEFSARTPSSVVIAVGINDVPHGGLAGTPIATFAANYSALVTRAKMMAPDVLIVTPTNVDEMRPEHDYKNNDISKLVEVVENTAIENGVPYVNVFGLLTPQDLWPDGLHPGPEGHEKLHRTISPVIFNRLVSDN